MGQHLQLLGRINAVHELGIRHIDIRLRRAPASGRDMIPGGIESDAVQPSIEGTLPAKFRQRPERPYKGFLGNILNFVGIVEVPPDEAEHLVLVAREQQFKRRLVAPLEATHEFAIVILRQFPWARVTRSRYCADKSVAIRVVL